MTDETNATVEEQQARARLIVARHLMSQADQDLMKGIGEAITNHCAGQEGGWDIDVLVSSLIDQAAYLIAVYGNTDLHSPRGLLAAAATGLTLVGVEFIQQAEAEHVQRGTVN